MYVVGCILNLSILKTASRIVLILKSIQVLSFQTLCSPIEKLPLRPYRIFKLFENGLILNLYYNCCSIYSSVQKFRKTPLGKELVVRLVKSRCVVSFQNRLQYTHVHGLHHYVSFHTDIRIRTKLRNSFLGKSASGNWLFVFERFR